MTLGCGKRSLQSTTASNGRRLRQTNTTTTSPSSHGRKERHLAPLEKNSLADMAVKDLREKLLDLV